MRFHHADWEAWYDVEARVLWLFDDPFDELEYGWNLWYVYNDHCVLTGTYWWWGRWEPPYCDDVPPYGCDGLEVAVEGESIPFDPEDLWLRVAGMDRTAAHYFAHATDIVKGMTEADASDIVKPATNCRGS